MPAIAAAQHVRPFLAGTEQIRDGDGDGSLSGASRRQIADAMIAENKYIF